MKLTTRINLVLVSACGIGLLATAGVSYVLLQQNARDEVIQHASIMMQAALAIRGYTVKEIRPLLAERLTKDFLPQSVPSYAATQNFQRLRESHPDYIYKEATLNPTNPRDHATDWETDIIQQFRHTPGLTEVIGERDTPTGPSLYLARPIVIKDTGCLICHSTPKAAPASMLALYGNDNGFGWKEGEVVGSQIVSVPLEVPLAKAHRTFLIMLGVLTVAFVLLFLVLNLFINRVVVRRLCRMAAAAEQVSLGKAAVMEFDDQGRDEIGELCGSFKRMGHSLDKAMKLLED